MKQNLVKKVLLVGAFALLGNTVPAHGMSYVPSFKLPNISAMTPEWVTTQVNRIAGAFGYLKLSTLQTAFTNTKDRLMNSLDEFRKNPTKFSKTKVAALVLLVITVLALVYALSSARTSINKSLVPVPTELNFE